VDLLAFTDFFVNLSYKLLRSFDLLWMCWKLTTCRNSMLCN